MLPSVRNILASTELQRGAPEVLAGRAALDREVRWTHIVETTNVEPLLRGHELVLSTGAAWPTQPQALEALASALAKVGIAALVLELSDRLPHAPSALVDAFRRHGLPLIVLHSTVQFIAVAESVHSAIVAQQMATLRAREDLNNRFAQMIARGASSTFILQQCSELLRQPVLLVDAAARIVALNTAGLATTDVVQSWRENPANWLSAEVTAHGQHWGTVWTPAATAQTAPHVAGNDYLLSQAALALAVARLADGSENSWRTARDAQLISAIRSGDYATEAEILAQATAVGFPLDQKPIFALGLLLPTDATDVSASRLAELLDAANLPVCLMKEAPMRNREQFSLLLSGGETGRLAAALQAEWPAAHISVGQQALTPGELKASLQEASDLLAMPASAPQQTSQDSLLRAEAHQLRLLIHGLRSQSSLPTFVRATLGPILDWDAKHAGDLLDVLRAYLRHPGNRTAAAAASHLSRSVFYQRLTLLEEVLAADLSSGETISALFSAVLAHDSLSEGTR